MRQRIWPLLEDLMLKRTRKSNEVVIASSICRCLSHRGHCLSSCSDAGAPHTHLGQFFRTCLMYKSSVVPASVPMTDACLKQHFASDISCIIFPDVIEQSRPSNFFKVYLLYTGDVLRFKVQYICLCTCLHPCPPPSHSKIVQLLTF